ncbi:MAG: TlpA family protein disulfide reductase [Rikenellaceae bacterium]|nr:TlpA family protein disulfide reductase [Rikenellaceae bacterium]
MIVRSLICSALALCACGEAVAAGKNAERVEVELKNAGDSVVAIYYAVGGPMPDDRDMKTLPMLDGRFSLDVPQTDSVYEVLFYPSKAAEPIGRKRQRGGWVPNIKVCRFYLFPGERIRVTGELNDSMLVWRSNAPLYEQKRLVEQGEFAEFRFKEYKADREAEIIFATSASEDTIRAAFDRSRRWRNAQRAWEQAWLEKNPNQELAGLYLLQSPSDELDSLYNMLGENVRDGRLKPLLDSRMASYNEYRDNARARERMNAGKELPAPDFTLSDVQGNPLKLSSLYNRGKYTVLDFWGMWCGWCVKGIPQMKEYYAKYKDRVEFVGIDCNEPEQTWRKGLEKHRMPWIGVWAGNDRSVQTQYGIQAFPTKIVIDPAGVIVKRFEGESEEFYQYLDSLFGTAE